MHDVIIIALCAVIDRKLTPHMTLTLKSLTMTSTLCKLKRTQAYMYEQNRGLHLSDHHDQHQATLGMEILWCLILAPLELVNEFEIAPQEALPHRSPGWFICRRGLQVMCPCESLRCDGPHAVEVCDVTTHANVTIGTKLSLRRLSDAWMGVILVTLAPQFM